MSSTGAGYDFSAGVFSPDGRIFQVEYAAKAVENSGTAVGIKCVDGIVVAVEKVRSLFNSFKITACGESPQLLLRSSFSLPNPFPNLPSPHTLYFSPILAPVLKNVGTGF